MFYVASSFILKYPKWNSQEFAMIKNAGVFTILFSIFLFSAPICIASTVGDSKNKELKVQEKFDKKFWKLF